MDNADGRVLVVSFTRRWFVFIGVNRDAPSSQAVSQSSTAFMASTHDNSVSQTPLKFGEEYTAGMSAIWSCKFSADGNEVFAGGPGPIYGMRQGICYWRLG